MKERAEIQITGVVQGVGFRPFIYRLANNLGLVGYVLNLGNAGVQIVVEGERAAIEHLIHEIRFRAPAISRIDAINVQWTKATGEFADFSIKMSVKMKQDTVTLDTPPDIAICDDCVRDLLDTNSRWYLYPFTSCSACGPRFSMITDIPYDRPNTTMSDFPLCRNCNTEYNSPSDRRFHAQTTACPLCGPVYHLLDGSGKPLEVYNPIAYAAGLIKRGKIVAVQGMSGTHLATMTTKPGPIQELRERKRRFGRPFAIMVRNLETVSQVFAVSPREIDLLTSWRRPIVLVRKKSRSTTAGKDFSRLQSRLLADSLDLVSPGLDTVGVMLPYSALHHLLFRDLEEPALVMTSANPTGMPMYIEPQTIVSQLKGISDYFLVHNRKIEQRADDSVVKFAANGPVFIRRARGYVPEPIALTGLPNNLRVVAMGPEEKATGAVLKSNKVYQTQHIGDTDRIENIEFLWDALKHLMRILAMDRFDAVACDLHPEFLSTDFARKVAKEHGVPLFQVQHHHAHLASLIADSGLSPDTCIVCITADGYGYGPVGDAWGGDVLLGDATEANRVGGLQSQTYVGGDLSAKYSVRALLGIVNDSVDTDQVLDMVGEADIGPNIAASNESLSVLNEMRRRSVNVVHSTSAGRFLDAVAAALGVCFENTYDGECPMKLEAIAQQSDLRFDEEYADEHSLVLDTTAALQKVLQLRKEGVAIGEIAYAAQRHLGESLATIACAVSKERGLEFVGISGGVAVNRIIMEAVTRRVEREGLRLLVHEDVPPGDGGISVGQVLVSASRIKR